MKSKRQMKLVELQNLGQVEIYKGDLPNHFILAKGLSNVNFRIQDGQVEVFGNNRDVTRMIQNALQSRFDQAKIN